MWSCVEIQLVAHVIEAWNVLRQGLRIDDVFAIIKMSLLTQALAKQLVLVAYVIPRYESLLCFFARLTAWWRWAACRRVTSDTHVRDEVNSRLRCSLFAASGACSASSFFVVAHRLWRVTASAQLIVSSVWRDNICFWKEIFYHVGAATNFRSRFPEVTLKLCVITTSLQYFVLSQVFARSKRSGRFTAIVTSWGALLRSDEAFGQVHVNIWSHPGIYSALQFSVVLSSGVVFFN